MNTKKLKLSFYLKVVLVSMIILFSFNIVNSYAISETDNYRVSFSQDSTTAASKTVTTQNNYTLPNNTFTKTGYTFVGWVVKGNDYNGDRCYTEGEKINLAKINGTTDITFVAQWAKNGDYYTIKYEGNGATSGTMPTYNCAFTNLTGYKGNYYIENKFEKTGYEIKEWILTLEDGYTITKLPDESISFAQVFVEKHSTNNTIIATPKWKPITYKITYVLNGGTNVTNPITEYTVETKLTSLPRPSKSGYTFLGWYRTSNFLNGISNVPPTTPGDITLYAKWLENKTYTIHFFAPGSTSGEMSNVEVNFDENYTLPANKFTRDGYTFVGWNTEQNGTGNSYPDKAIVRNIASKDKGYVYLYARWKENSNYTITYNLNGGKNNSKNPSTYEKTSATITLAAPTKTGHAFVGWYSDSGFTKPVTEIVKGSTGNKTLYAKWRTVKYSITYNLNGGKNNSKNPTTYTITTATTKLENPTKTGYALVGWYSDSSFTKPVTEITKGSYGNKTLYAKWRTVKYSIEYKLNGGKNNSKNPTTYTITTATTKLQNPTRTGYTFGGWYSDSSFKTKVTEIAKGNTGRKTIYAKWTANKYSIKFNGNGATKGTMSNMTSLVYDKEYTLTANAFAKTGYTFAGWNTKADGTGTTYANKAVVKNLKCNNGMSITLYAMWKIPTYKITYNLNGGKNSTKNPSTYTASTATITLVEPTKTGYAFVGWYSDSSFTKPITKIVKGSTGNKTVYAKWRTVKYSIKYDLNGGKNNSKNPTIYTITTETTKLQNPTKTGYAFVGWYSDSNFTKPVTEITKGSYGSKTLYAKWRTVKYSIVYNLNGGKNNSKNPATYTIEATVALKEPTKSGYAFVGWYSDSSFTKPVTEIAKGNTGKKTVYAKWRTVTYGIVYNLNGGKNNSKNPSTYTITTATTKLQNPTKTGYTFGGWYSDSSFKTKVTEITKGSYGRKTLYAKWNPICYEITFNGNGATSGSTTKMLLKYGTSYNITENAFAKDGFVFTGWNTKADGTGTAYANKATVKNLSSKSNAVITLYAQWERSYKTISLSVIPHTQAEIKAFINSHPTSTIDTFEVNPVTSGTVSAGKLSKETITASLNVLNNIRYIAGLGSDVKENATYSANASAGTLLNYLNRTLSHFPEVPAGLTKEDPLYKAGYYGTSHSNIASGFNSIYSSIINGYLEDSDASNIDRLGHRRWLLDPNLTEVGFGRTERYYAIQVFDDSSWSYPSAKSVAWPAQNTPLEYFNTNSAWSVSMGKTIQMSSPSDVRVVVKRDSDNKTWNFKEVGGQNDGFFNVENSGYGDPGCIIFKPEGLTVKAGESYTVTIYLESLEQKLQYKVNFFNL